MRKKIDGHPRVKEEYEIVQIMRKICIKEMRIDKLFKAPAR